MSDIQHLIKMLQSKNPDERYDACEELRVSPSLPPEVLDALRLATNDANPDVADAANRALALHTEMKNNPDPSTQNQLDNETSWQFVGIGAITGLVVMLLLSALDPISRPAYYNKPLWNPWDPRPWEGFFLFVWTEYSDPMYRLSPAILFGIAGALTGKSLRSSRRAIWIGAILGSLIFGIILSVFSIA